MTTTQEKVDRLAKTVEELTEAIEQADPLSSQERKNLDDSQFAVPGKRKLPLDTCSRVKNAMARFNQTEGLSADEKKTAYNKIIRRANECDIDPSGFRDKYGGRYG